MMNDNFPYIVEEDGGYTIYVDDEKVDWYDNEADAEGVALCMIDDFDEEDFIKDEPLDESTKYPTKKSVLKKFEAFMDDTTVILTQDEMDWLKCFLITDQKTYDIIEKHNTRRIDRQEMLPKIERFKAKGILSEKFKESVTGIYSGSEYIEYPYFTGLPYKDEYYSIVEAPHVQASDGIGEGSGRESAIFAYYYKDCYARGYNINGEFVVDVRCEPSQLVRGIWRIAQIERSDNGVKNKDKDMYYEYLGADWKDICKVCAAINAIESGKKENKPWSQEKAEEVKAKKAKAEADRIAKEKAEKEAAAEKESERVSTINNNISSFTPDAKDTQRAEDAYMKMIRHNETWYYFIRRLGQQLNKITDDGKYKRRQVAFYKVFMDNAKPTDEGYSSVKSSLEGCIERL